MLPLCTGSEDVHIRCPRVLRGWFQSVMKVALSCDLVAAEDGGHARDDHHKGAVRHFRSGGNKGGTATREGLKEKQTKADTWSSMHCNMATLRDTYKGGV